MSLQKPSNEATLGIHRFNRRVIADHPFTRRNQIVSNIVRGGKCLFQDDFPTCLQLHLSSTGNERDSKAASRIIQEQQIRDVILLQGKIYSKSILLQYTKTRAARIAVAGYFKNPSGNGQKFMLQDIENAPCTLTGEELLDYAIRSTGEDVDAIFRHELKLILAKDLNIKLEEDKTYTLFWYVSMLQQASNWWVENAEAAFTNHLTMPTRKRQSGIGRWFLRKIFHFMVRVLMLLLPALVSKIFMDDPYSKIEEAREDASAAKKELLSKCEELKRSNGMIQKLHRDMEQNQNLIAIWKASIESYESRQRELMRERDWYRNLVHQAEKNNGARNHQPCMNSFDELASEASYNQTKMEWLQHYEHH